MFSSVDLPLPDAPSSTMNSPSIRSRSMLSSAWIRTSPMV